MTVLLLLAVIWLVAAAGAVCFVAGATRLGREVEHRETAVLAEAERIIAEAARD